MVIRHSQSLRLRVMAAFLVVAALPVAVLTYYSAGVTQTVVEGFAFNRMRYDAEFLAQRLESQLAIWKENADFLRSLPAIHGYLRAVDGDSEGSVETGCTLATCLALLQASLTVFGKSHLEYHHIQLADDAGRVILQVGFSGAEAQTSEVAVADILSQPAGRVLVSPVELDRRDGQAVEAAVPVLRFSTAIADSRGKPRLVLMTEVKADALLDRVAARNVEHWRGYLLDERGRYLYHPDPAKRWTPQRPVDASLGGDYPETEMVRGASQAGILDHAGDSGLAFASVVPAQWDQTRQWMVVLGAPREAILGELSEIQGRLLMVGGLLLLLAVAGGAWFAQRLILTPVQELDGLVLRVAGGDLGARVAVERQDELGRLAQAFNEMARKVQLARDHLEGMVEERTAQLWQRETLLKSIFDVSSIGFCVIDDQGRILRINQAFCDIFGFDRDELSASHMPLELSQEIKGESDRLLAQQALGFGGAAGEWPTLRKDGMPIWVHLSSGLIDDKIGRRLNVVSVLDITAQKRTEESLESQTQELRRSNEDLENFAYVASHDLQEPLRKIQTFAEFLKEDHREQLNEEGRFYITRLTDSAGRMRMLINDLLAYSRVGRNQPTFGDVDLNVTLSNVLLDLQAMIERTGARIDICDLPVLHAEPIQMHQILQNLIGNGIKYHRKDRPPHISLECRVVANPKPDPACTPILALAEMPGACCEISVQDNGIGFDEKYMHQIFKFFSRLHSRDDYDGTGIGLAICRKIVEMHHGAVTVSSIPGQGSRFTVILPLPAPVGEV